MKPLFVLLIGGTLVLSTNQPSVAGSNSFLGGAIVGGVGVMLFNSLNRKNSHARSAPRERVRRRVVRRRHPSAALEPRMTRETKRDIQQALNEREFNVGFADGSFGSNTRRGIRLFQSSISAPATGYLTQRQVNLLLDRAIEPKNTVIPGRIPTPAQGYAPVPAYGAPPTYNNAQTFQSLETAPAPVVAVASRGYANSAAKGYLEDAPQ